MKPIFIRHYTPELERMHDEFVNEYIDNSRKAEHDFLDGDKDAKSFQGGSGVYSAMKTHINSGRLLTPTASETAPQKRGSFDQ